MRDSDYLESHLIAVPKQIIKDFVKTYESISPFVVPRSAQLIGSDEEFSLYAVTTFKKHSQEFIHKCREHKWTPRDFKYTDRGKLEEEQELGRLRKEEAKTRNEALRLGRTAWGEAMMAWIHVLALRVFVETVLRYGLPLAFVCGIVQVGLPCRIHYGTTTNMNAHSRQVRNWSRRLVAHLMHHIPILGAMLLVEIKRVVSPRMTSQHRQICKLQDIWQMAESTPHMYATNSRLIEPD